MNVKGCNFT